MRGGAIDQFWEWFLASRRRLETTLVSGSARDLSEIVGPQIRLLSEDIGWEIGPSGESGYGLAFTLNGNLENLALIGEILRAAPRETGWRFSAGRPRRDVSGGFVFHNKRGQRLDVDVSEWRYTLTAFDGGAFFDVHIATGLPLQADERGIQQILSTAVQMMLGEAEMLRVIDRVEYIVDPDAEWDSRASPFSSLADHIDSLRASPGERE
ncbi:hypothetical protein VT03_23820 [Planctomyces sp. SH-PL14]|nr:hypothetical protein VT03_23820 [Planctomyces sp. SH-PL14]